MSLVLSDIAKIIIIGLDIEYIDRLIFQILHTKYNIF